VNVLSGECSPTSSFPFWQRLGFERYNDGANFTILVRRILHRSFALPRGKPHVAVTIGFYPEEALYRPGITAVAIYQARAVTLADGTVMLEQRAIGLISGIEGDLAVKIEVDGVQRCFCKAKYDVAVDAGVQYDGPGNNFFIDIVKAPNIRLPAS
jgi:hypothetical protein